MSTYMRESFSNDLKDMISKPFAIVGISTFFAFVGYIPIWIFFLIVDVKFPHSTLNTYLGSLPVATFISFFIGGLGIYGLLSLKMDYNYKVFSLENHMERNIVSFFVSVAVSPFWFWLCLVTMPPNVFDAILIISLTNLMFFIILLFMDIRFLRKIEKQHKELPIQTTKGEENSMASKPTYDGIKELSKFSIHSVPSEIRDEFEQMRESVELLSSRIPQNSSAVWDEIEQQCAYTKETLLLYYRMSPKNRPIIEEEVKTILTQMLTNADAFLLDMDKKSIGRIQEVYTYMTENE